MDNFYKPLTKEQKDLAFNSKWDFDSPGSFDLDLLVQTLKDLKTGKKVQIPTYSFAQHDRTDKWMTIYGANVVILEGIYALYDERVLEQLDLKIFVDTDFDICLARRLNRDILHRGRELELSIRQWERFVKPNFMRYIRFTMDNADVLVPRGLENEIAINMLAKLIQRHLKEKSAQHLEDLLQLGKDCKVNDDFVVVGSTPQIEAIHTTLLSQNTSRDDFVFSFDRVASILVSRALDVLDNYAPMTVTTPQGVPYHGIKLPYEDLCAVGVIRGGECFTRAIRATIPGVRLGKLLIQSDSRTGEPKLHTLKLPPCIDPPPAGRASADDLQTLQWTKVMLLDTQISSGAAATMATAVLVDHGVPEENIIVVAYMSTEVGLRRLKAAFPLVRVVVGRIERTFFGRFIESRYYGTN